MPVPHIPTETTRGDSRAVAAVVLHRYRKDPTTGMTVMCARDYANVVGQAMEGVAWATAALNMLRIAKWWEPEGLRKSAGEYWREWKRRADRGEFAKLGFCPMCHRLAILRHHAMAVPIPHPDYGTLTKHYCKPCLQSVSVDLLFADDQIGKDPWDFSWVDGLKTIAHSYGELRNAVDESAYRFRMLNAGWVSQPWGNSVPISNIGS